MIQAAAAVISIVAAPHMHVPQYMYTAIIPNWLAIFI